MKVTRHAIIALAMGAALALAGCGSTSDSGGISGSANEPVAAEQTQPATTVASDYAVTIDGARVTSDYEGNPVVAITYTFTNNSDDTTSFMVAINTQVFQNGIELDSAYMVDDVDVSKTMSDIKPGASIQVEEVYALNDMSEIEVEVSELFSFSDDLLASQTFTLE